MRWRSLPSIGIFSVVDMRFSCISNHRLLRVTSPSRTSATDGRLCNIPSTLSSYLFHHQLYITNRFTEAYREAGLPGTIVHEPSLLSVWQHWQHPPTDFPVAQDSILVFIDFPNAIVYNPAIGILVAIHDGNSFLKIL